MWSKRDVLIIFQVVLFFFTEEIAVVAKRLDFCTSEAYIEEFYLFN